MNDKTQTCVIAFVLLYYKDFDNTIECISSINNINMGKNKIEIVLVDNYSRDGAIEKFKEIFEDYNNISYIENKENLGFAKGNNIGIIYAKKELNADFVVAINTDTIIKQREFCDLLIEVYKQEQYFVMGPNVLGVSSGQSQSPIYYSIKQNIKLKLVKDIMYWILWKTRLIHIVDKIKRAKKTENDSERNIDKYNCVCSGCCLIFSPVFLERWNGFYSGTFMYREESILFYVLNQLGCKTIYCKDLELFHKGGESTKREFGKGAKRNLKVYENRIKSLSHEVRIYNMAKSDLEKLLI